MVRSSSNPTFRPPAEFNISDVFPQWIHLGIYRENRDHVAPFPVGSFQVLERIIFVFYISVKSGKIVRPGISFSFGNSYSFQRDAAPTRSHKSGPHSFDGLLVRFLECHQFDQVLQSFGFLPLLNKCSDELIIDQIMIGV